jgi:GNAT superfamily N-acetyltransferase
VSDAERYRFEPLGGHHRAAFSCGIEALDRYFRERAGQDQRRGVANCFVLYDLTEAAVVGYYTLSATAVVLTSLPDDYAKKLPRYPHLPGILIGRLAVDARYQGQGFGRRLLVDALRRARSVTSHVAAVVVVVDAKDEAAAQFYEAHDFIRFADDPLRLYLPIATIQSF